MDVFLSTLLEKKKNVISIAYSSKEKNGPKNYMHKQNIATMECKLLTVVRLVIRRGECKLESPNWKHTEVLEMSWGKMR